MQVELLELRENRVRFLLRGVTPAFANAIRRACLCEVPTLAIDEISIYDNTSVLFDEQLSLRLGMIPLESEDLGQFVVSEDCDCGGVGCPACQVGMTLTSEGPGTVYSGDIRFDDPSVKVAYEKIPLVTLGVDEKLMLEGIVTLNRGTVHSKWQAGTFCGYKNLPEILISEDCDGCGRCVETCPRDILVLEEGKAKVIDPVNCSLCRLCVDDCESGAIKVVPIEDAFVINIDSDGSIKARDQVSIAADDIKWRAESLREQLAEFV